MKYQNGTRVGTNCSDPNNVPFLPPHLITTEHAISLYCSRSLQHFLFFICIDEFSTAKLTNHLQNLETVALCQFLKPFHLLGSIGTLLHSTGVEIQSIGSFLQEGQKVSLQRENLKFELEKERLKKPTLHVIYL